MRLFLHAHQYYDYDELCDELCDELENIRRKKGGSLEDLFSIFKHIFFRFHKNDKPSGKELYNWSLYLLCHNNDQDQSKNNEPIIDSLNEIPL